MQDLSDLVSQAEAAITQASDLNALDQIRGEYMGKKGVFTQYLKQLGDMPADERPKVGQAVN